MIWGSVKNFPPRLPTFSKVLLASLLSYPKLKGAINPMEGLVDLQLTDIEAILQSLELIRDQEKLAIYQKNKVVRGDFS